MKRYLLSLLAGFAGFDLAAQTADQDVANGLAFLAQQNLVSANQQFTNALAVSSTNAAANVLAAATRLLLLPNTPAGSNFLSSLGYSAAGRNIYNWTSSLPVDAGGDQLLPSINTAAMIAFYRTNVMAALAASRTNLARITDPTFTLALTADQTSTEAVTLDYGDLLLLQALERAAEFAGYTANAQNGDVVLSQLQSLGKTNGLTIQRVLALYPSLLLLANAGDLAASEAAFTNAAALYFAASDFIRSVRPPGTPALFVLSDEETNEEATFRTQLTNALASLNGPVAFNNSDSSGSATINASNYFAGTKTLRSLLPQFSGDTYVPDSLPDYTFGGILLNQPAYRVEEALRHSFYSYAGMYLGDSGISDVNGGYGNFAVFVDTNQQATLVGTDYGDGFNDGSDFGVILQFSVDKNGNWQVNSNDFSAYGQIGKDGSFWGELDVPTNFFSVYFYANQSSALGPFENTAGFYTASSSPTTDGILAPDGELFLCVYHGNGTLSDSTGGSSQLGANNQFASTNIGGAIVTGTLNPSTFQIIGSTDDPSTGKTTPWTLTRAGNVPFDFPPVITRNLPAALTAQVGTNLTVSLLATGSPPMSFQWYAGGIALPFATTNTLVLNKLQLSDAGAYSVTINNVGGETNAAFNLSVGCASTPPTNQITAPSAGQLWSNSVFVVTGKALGNAAVSNVFYSLNQGGWTNALPVNTWSNWMAQVTLVPGTNTLAAYAVDTCGNVSATTTATIVYVLSAPLAINVVGQGTVGGAVNGQLEPLGQNLSLTATPGTGFVLTNWLVQAGGVTMLSTNKVVPFLMASNLTLTATFADVQPPVLTLTTPTANERWSNSVFTVTGTTTDNGVVTNVSYQLNGGGWQAATPAVTTAMPSWSNWTAQVTLTPGTNVVMAYALDGWGNPSAIVTQSMVYVLSAPLTINVVGQGTVGGAVNGQLEPLGQNLSLTATPGTGFVLTNWLVQAGGVTMLSTNKVAPFLMASNLTLTATFADVQPPVLTLTTPTANERWSNSVFTVTGTTTDNGVVTNVSYQLNGGGWQAATPAVTTAMPSWSNWTAQVTLTPGTNVVMAYALDGWGNPSAIVTQSMVYVLSAPLTINVVGQGTVGGAVNGQLEPLGQNLSLTATPGTGFVLTNWLVQAGGVTILSTNKVAPFLMASNLTLTATFADVQPPVLTLTTPTANERWSNSVFTVTGTTTDNGVVTNVSYQLNGGGWQAATPAVTTAMPSWSNWTAQVTLTPGTNVVMAYALDGWGNPSAIVTQSMVYVLSAPLTINVVGQGTVGGAVNGQLEPLGQNLSLTATPGTGFVLTNWLVQAGGVTILSTNKVAPFLMASNLTLTATFADVQPPVLTLTTPTANERWSNSVFTVTGTTTDNGVVTNVDYRLNGGGWQAATPAVTTAMPSWSNWTAQVTLTPGTNVVMAYALDGGGNPSAIVTQSMVYVLSAPLTINVVGQGTVGGAVNGQLEPLGQNLSLTATPGTGFVLTNWLVQAGGVTILSTNKVAPFLMASNLTLTATFADVQKPVLTVTTPTANERWSNSVFTVTGTTTDNGVVTNVSYQLNGGGWQAATPAVTTAMPSWSNWTAQVTLTPGTNVVMAYALDGWGNPSAIVTQSMVYVLSAPLTINVVGQGTVGGAVNGQLEPLGQNLSLTATPGTGFVLTNWLVQAGGVTMLSTNKVAPFLMASNLTLTATFADVQPPVLTLTTPTANERWSNSVFTVTGTTTDNGVVTNVSYQLNGGGWQAATPAVTTAMPSWSNWTAQVTLTPGTNVVMAYALDGWGNPSAIVTQSMVYVLSAPLTINVVGQGTVGGAVNGQLEPLGQNLTLTATPGTGFVLTNWLVQAGGVTMLSTNKVAPFLMASNLTLTATFADVQKPVLTLTTPTANERWSNSVFTVTGTTTDNGVVTNVSYQLNGGGWQAATPAVTTAMPSWSNWTAQVTLTPGTNVVMAYALDGWGNPSAIVTQSMVYVLSAPLAITVVGQGTVGGAVNGQLEPLGQNLLLTATPGTGFVLTNWLVQAGGVTMLSTNKVAPFLMASNLTLTATFADVQPPVLTLTTPTANERWSNSVFTVTGTTTDNGVVTNVSYQLNSGGWQAATPAVTTAMPSWSNWTAQVTLTPGTNVVMAYALDGGGNPSAIVTQSMVYVLSAPLTINVVGQGTVGGAVNGQLEPLGQNLTLTATPGTGFVLTNWLVQAGGVTILSTNKVAPFLMASNLTLTATFADVQKPVLTLTTPTANERWSNSVFTVTGATTDNGVVTNVSYQLNGGGWQAATPAVTTAMPSWSNWTAQVTLTPGTNVVMAYALDGGGNPSAIVTQSMVYVLSAPLTINVVGQGTVGGAVNGQLEPLGQNLSLTATPGTGFVLTNWLVQAGGVTMLSTNKVAPFLMASNLTLTATFADVQKPVLTVTTPTANERWSNSVFTVTGTTTDNGVVTNVSYQLNGGGWQAATPAVTTAMPSWSNWTAQVTLTPGTNVVMAYALDGWGNPSAIVTQSMVYVLSGVLTVNVGHGGTVTPNDNGALLQLGATYSLTASAVAGSGVMFTNWTGGTNLPLAWLTNGTTVQFTMVSNLVLQANFTDTNRPVLSITSVVNSNGTLIVSGTNNETAAQVYGQLNGASWLAGSVNTNNDTWTWLNSMTNVVPGTNQFEFYAQALSGYRSLTNSLPLIYQVPALLIVRTNGLGTLSPDDNGMSLMLGENYSITATPAAGFVFTNWTGSTNFQFAVITNGPTLQFTMATNLILQANFLETNRPLLTITAPPNGQHQSNALAYVTGTAIDSWKVTGVWCQLNSNSWVLAASTNGWTNWATTFNLIAGTNLIRAFAADLGGNYSVTNSLGVFSSNTFALRFSLASDTKPLSASGYALNLQVSPGLAGQILVSTNLADWSVLTNFVGTNPAVNFRDPAATNGLRFYRAVIP